MRPINLRVAGDQNAECYLATLPGAAGGLLENVNRWREQMGAAPIDEHALAALPRTKLLGREAVVVEVDGAFTPMGSNVALQDARMVGAIAALPAVTLFVKMTGPREVVQKERAAFDRLLASIKMRGASNTKAREAEAARDAGAGDPHGKEPEAGGGGSGGLRWTAPSEWERAGDRVMRLVTYLPKGSDGVECYITVLGGDAGGVRDNVNRWREQFALPAQTQAEVEALPTVKMLGHDAVIVELSGTFTGMGAAPKEHYGLLGTMAPFQDSTVFVKMTGPKAQVSSERERFLAFCRSLGGG
jgi:hypothetical protein